MLIYLSAAEHPGTGKEISRYGVAFYLFVFFFKKQPDWLVAFLLVSKLLRVNPGSVFKLSFAPLRVTDTPGFGRKVPESWRLEQCDETGNKPRVGGMLLYHISH